MLGFLSRTDNEAHSDSTSDRVQANGGDTGDLANKRKRKERKTWTKINSSSFSMCFDTFLGIYCLDCHELPFGLMDYSSLLCNLVLALQICAS